MLNKIVKVSLLMVLSAALGYASFRYQNNAYLEKSLYSVLAFTIIYLIFKIFLDEFVVHRMATSKARYSFRRVLFTLYLFIFVAAILAIWVKDTQSLIVSYGLLAAGLAFALQDIFKSIAGGYLYSPVVYTVWATGLKSMVNTGMLLISASCILPFWS